MADDESQEPFEALLLNEQLREGTIEEQFADFGLTVDEAAKVREFQDTHDLRLLFIYLRFRGRAKRYFQKYGDYFAF